LLLVQSVLEVILLSGESPLREFALTESSAGLAANSSALLFPRRVPRSLHENIKPQMRRLVWEKRVLLPIALPSSPAIANIFVGGSLFLK